ncbi:hypothetical protein EVAR_84553_1 [Eumeta japonica]|uniref:Uncharacterized protein n=1 Tax=Eumeta variegata TaxID=151549 RepID=A0A4C1UHN4_EUMVA|nr:hypothetical protein EVAR_84553_1 [Eumeta japonica]
MWEDFQNSSLFIAAGYILRSSNYQRVCGRVTRSAKLLRRSRRQIGGADPSRCVAFVLGNPVNKRISICCSCCVCGDGPAMSQDTATSDDHYKQRDGEDQTGKDEKDDLPNDGVTTS